MLANVEPGTGNKKCNTLEALTLTLGAGTEDTVLARAYFFIHKKENFRKFEQNCTDEQLKIKLLPAKSGKKNKEKKLDAETLNFY